MHIGTTYLQSKNLTKAEEYLKLSENKIKEVKTLKDSSIISNVYFWQGRMYNEKKDYAKAGVLLNKAYTLQAVPANDQVNDTTCLTLTLTSAGVRDASGSGGAAACWNK